MKKIATIFTAILLAAAMLLPQAMLADQGLPEAPLMLR